MDKQEVLLKIQHLWAGYSEKSVLDDVSLEVRGGAVTVIAGPNGCGKSTLLKTLVGIVEKRRGEILIDRSLDEFSPQERAQRIAYLAQSKNVPDITALRMVLHGRFPYLSFPRRYRSTDFDIARQAMERMGILELADQPMSTLSGGTRQKVYIAMALAQETPVILLDEPASALDPISTLKIEELINDLKHDYTIIIVTHNMQQAARVSDYTAFMYMGSLIEYGDTDMLFTNPTKRQTEDYITGRYG